VTSCALVIVGFVVGVVVNYTGVLYEPGLHVTLEVMNVINVQNISLYTC